MFLFLKSKGNNALKTSQSKFNSISVVSFEASDLDWQRETNNLEKKAAEVQVS